MAGNLSHMQYQCKVTRMSECSWSSWAVFSMTTGWLGGEMVGLACDFRSRVKFPDMTLASYFWVMWPYFVAELSWDITTTQVNSALHPSGVVKSSTSFGWGKGGKVTTAGWQVTPCDLIWHVISRSGAMILITNCYIRFILRYFTNLISLF